MTEHLDQSQQRLERHFESLARTRAETGFPIFALEHGLSEDDLKCISVILRSRLKARLPPSPHWLLWVIYATERGYTYTGDEYWHSFEEQVPGWEFSYRYLIGSWFHKFQKAYHGVMPSGPWAEHFRIIAWPITHAILPRFLQSQFARALYDLRFSLASLSTHEPLRIGRLLASNAHHASTRFQEFLQQEELTGRIVLALLGAEPSEGKEPICLPTLQRIVTDLEKVRAAREWLNETKRVVSDRFKGIGRGSGPPAERPSIGPPGRAGPDAARIAVRPNLLLRHAGGGTWSVLLEVPSFRSVAALSADVQSFLQRTRCRLNGGNDMKPTGWLLSGNRKGALPSWPDAAKPLIQFELSHPVIDHLLESECRLSPGPMWLFKIGSDGTAREITGRIVRPSRGYIVATKGELPQAHAGMSPCNLDCEGVKSFRLAIPPDVSAEMTAWLQGLGLQVARTIRVWPAGLPGRGWDGEGKSEWLTSEAPCFGMVHDHPVDGYTLRLDHATETVVEAGGVGTPVFVRLPNLSPGHHTLTVKARRNTHLASVVTSPPAEGFIQLVVREPEPWNRGAAAHTGLIVRLDPHDADLDTLWENKISLSVLGPASYEVTCKVSLETCDGKKIFDEQVDGPLPLPISPDIWAKRFANFVKNEHRAWLYLEAAAGSLTIQGEELGQYLSRFERVIQPLRWILRNVNGRIVIKLVDDTGLNASAPTLAFFSMKRPVIQVPIPNDIQAGRIVEPPGGLFIAQRGTYDDRIMVSAGLTGAGLKGLGVVPVFNEITNDVAFPLGAFPILESWLNARLAGFLADFRRKQITDAFIIAVFAKLCGNEWQRAECDFYSRKGSEYSIDALQKAVQRRSGFGASLRRDFESMTEDAISRCQWFVEKSERYEICTDKKLCDFALRLASQPHELRRIYGAEELESLVAQASVNQPLIRGARLVALLAAKTAHIGSSSILPAWKW